MERRSMTYLDSFNDLYSCSYAGGCDKFGNSQNVNTLYGVIMSMLVTSGHATSEASMAFPIPQHSLAYPPTERVPVVDHLHGTLVSDHYRWLENQTDATQTWVLQQHALTLSQIGNTPLCTWLSNRFDKLWRYDDTTVPDRLKISDRLFFWGQTKEQDRWVYFTKENKDARPEIVLDPNTWSKEKTLDVTSPSPNGRYVAYGIASGGDENPIVRILDLETRELLPDTLSGWKQNNICWFPNNAGFYYTAHPLKGTVPEGEEEFWHACYYHKLGTSANEDKKVFFDAVNKTRYHSGYVTEDDRYDVFYRSMFSKQEIFFKRHGTDDPLTPLATGTDGEYSVTFFQDRIYILTDVDAPMQKVFVTDVSKPGKEHWSLLIPERAGSKIDNIKIIEGRLYVDRLENAYTRIEIYDLKGVYLKDVPLPSIGSGSVEGFQAAKPGVLLDFTSFLHPMETFEYKFETDELISIKRTPIEVDTSRFVTQQVWFTSKDGTRVPMFILSHKDLARDGNNPTYLTGYGGFNEYELPNFSSLYLTLLEAGGIVAIPNLRGGGEFGREWHESGMKEKKQNVFDDFIAAAEYLIAEKYTRPNKLAIGGASNGGLLVGAALTQRPELFRAVLCEVPLLDMVNYHRWGLAKIWAEEYGSAEDPEEFQYLLKYSPYHNVKDQTHYPAVLIIGSDNDARVDPCHARKMAARLQEANASAHPILFYRADASGHHLGTTLTQSIEQYAHHYGFVMEQLGMRAPAQAFATINYI